MDIIDIEETTSVKSEVIDEPSIEHFNCYLCQLCGLTNFKNDLEYETHLKTHESIEPQVEVHVYSIALDDEELVYSTDNIDPLATPTSDPIPTPTKPIATTKFIETRRYKCSKCFGTFTSIALRDEHAKIHKEPKPTKTGTFSCSTCDLKFPTFRERDLHKKVHEPYYPPIPKNVPTKFSTPVITDSYSLTVKDAPNYKCSLCIQTFPTQSRAIVHERGHGNKWSCPFCPTGFELKSSLIVHINLGHPDAPNIEDIILIPNSLKCLECNLTFSDVSQTRQHEKNVHKNIQGFKHKCMKCTLVFKTRAHKLRHIISHQNTCFICSETFANSRRLQEHQRITHGDVDINKRSECSICDETFTTVAQVVVHEAKHGDKFLCQICSAGFKSKRGLTSHYKSLVHPNAEKFINNAVPCKKLKCLKCDKTFRTIYQRQLHDRNLHKFVQKSFKPTNMGRFECSKCSQIFVTAHRRNQHVQEKHSSQPYVPMVWRYCIKCHSTYQCLKNEMEHKKCRRRPSLNISSSSRGASNLPSSSIQVSTSMEEDVKPDVELMCNHFMIEKPEARINPEEVFIKSELEDFMYFKSETE